MGGQSHTQEIWSLGSIECVYREVSKCGTLSSPGIGAMQQARTHLRLWGVCTPNWLALAQLHYTRKPTDFSWKHAPKDWVDMEVWDQSIAECCFFTRSMPRTPLIFNETDEVEWYWPLSTGWSLHYLSHVIPNSIGLLKPCIIVAYFPKSLWTAWCIASHRSSFTIASCKPHQFSRSAILFPYGASDRHVTNSVIKYQIII